MFRGLAVLIVHVLSVPPLSLGGIIGNLFTRDKKPLYFVAKTWSRLVMWAGGIEVDVRGLDRLEAARPAVVVGNHTTNLDSWVMAANLTQPYRLVAKQSLFRIPFFGSAMRAAGVIPLQRRGGQTDIDRISTLRRELDAGCHVLFFAEGKRSRDGRLRPFKKGAFVTAIQQQVPIVPMVISGAHKHHPAGGIRFVPGTVRLDFLDGIPTEGMTIKDRDELIRRVRQAFIDTLPADQHPADVEAEPARAHHESA